MLLHFSPVTTQYIRLSSEYFSLARRYASAAASYGPVSVRSVTIRRSVETDERIGLAFGMGAFFHVSYTVFCHADGSLINDAR